MTELEELQERVNKQQQISHGDISRYQNKIANYLCNAFESSLHPQLSSYWNCWAQIVNKTNSKFVNIRKTTNTYISDMQKIDSMYQEIQEKQPEKHNAVLYAVFYIFILKVEKIEYALQQDFLDYSAHMTNCDIEQMFSHGNKVECAKRRSKYATHGRAIRDALAHKKFEICERDEQRYVVFNNKDHGYNFQESLTVDDFLTYVRGTDMLYRTMFMLQSLMLLCTLLHES